MNKFNTILTLAIILAAGNAPTAKALNGEAATKLDELFKHCSNKGPSVTGLNLRTVVGVRSQEQCFNDYAKAAQAHAPEIARILVAPLKAKFAADKANFEADKANFESSLNAESERLELEYTNKMRALAAEHHARLSEYINKLQDAEKGYIDADQQLAARFAAPEAAPAAEKAALIAALLSEARLLAAAQAQAETPATVESAVPAVEPAPAAVEAAAPTATAETPAAN